MRLASRIILSAATPLATAALLCAFQLPAQHTHSKPPATGSLRSFGGVTAWMPLCNADGSDPDLQQPVVAGVPDKYVERTAGSFGQSASDVGTAASNAGKSTSSPDINRNGYTEQDASTFGQTPSTLGTSASNYGQTASTYGTAPSNLQSATSNTPLTPAQAEVARTREITRREEAILESARLALLPHALGADFHLVAVPCGKLADQLAAIAGKPEAPDMLVGVLPRSWTPEQSSAWFVSREPGPDQPPNHLPSGDPRPSVAFHLLLRAPHPRYARAFALAVSDYCLGCIARAQDMDLPFPDWKAVHATATEAILQAAAGSSAGSLADPDAAPFLYAVGPALMLPQATAVSAIPPGGSASGPKVEITSIAADGPLAVVQARLLVDQPEAFGIIHPYVVLRRGADHRWRVLYTALNPAPTAIPAETEALLSGNPPRTAEAATGPLGVRLAAPPDGDARAPRPDLWWDNLGGAGMQVVEWQRQTPNGPNGDWLNPHLFFVPDHDARNQTRVTADFARIPGPYRWRVWSLGASGTLVLSDWRTFVIVGR